MSWQSPWPHGVTATGSCAQVGIHEHRLVERPVVLGLLGELPGVVPYPTHLEISAARARLVHRAIGESLNELGAEQMESSDMTTSAQPQEPEARSVPRAGDTLNADLVAQRMLSTQPRKLWPIGGMVDLVV